MKRFRKHHLSHREGILKKNKCDGGGDGGDGGGGGGLGSSPPDFRLCASTTRRQAPSSTLSCPDGIKPYDSLESLVSGGGCDVSSSDFCLVRCARLELSSGRHTLTSAQYHGHLVIGYEAELIVTESAEKADVVLELASLLIESGGTMTVGQSFDEPFGKLGSVFNLTLYGAYSDATNPTYPAITCSDSRCGMSETMW